MSLSGIGEIFDFGTKLLDKLIPDPAQKAAAQIELAKLAQNGELEQLHADTDLIKGQQEINLEEAKSENLFKSGWRPFIGWTCGLGFFAKFLVGPFLFIVAQLVGFPLVLPPIDVSEMMPLLIGLLGLGAYRTYEKVKK